MKKITLIILAGLISALNLFTTNYAQAQPQYYNFNTNGINNSFPFNQSGGKSLQVLYLPGDFNQPSAAPAGNLTSISFRIADSYPLGPWTYTDLEIKLGQSAITDFDGVNLYSGSLTTVYYSASVALTGTAGGWMTIVFDTPFAYDPNQSLIVDIGQCSAPGATGFSLCRSNVSGIKRNFSNAGCAFTFGGSSGAVYHIGFDIETCAADVDQPENQVVCNNGATAAVNFTGSGTSFNWTNNTTSIGLAASGSGDISSFTATNTGTTPVTATVTVTPNSNSGETPPSGWAYSAPYVITENSGSTLTDYQLRMEINTQDLITAGSLDPTGKDLRFGYNNGATLLNYWIESGLNTATTVIWVKVDNLPASANTTIYMYYGNPSATAVSAVSGTFVGPHSSTDSVASGGSGGVAGSQRGFRFAPNEDVLVTSFGKREPNGTTRYVTLFDFSSQAILNQTQVSGPAAQYSYTDISSPLWLTQSTQYLLELYQGAGDGYYFGVSSQIGQHLTYYDMKYCNGCTQNTFPTSTLSNYQYGYPDLWYFTKNNVSPAPTYVEGSGCAGTPKSFTITVNPSPGISCVGGTYYVANDEGLCSATLTDAQLLSRISSSTGTPAPTITFSPAAGTFAPGTTTVTATATNICGTAECTFDVYVYDDENPNAICQNATIYLDVNGYASISANDIDGGSTDNCGVDLLEADWTEFSCQDVGEQEVTLTVWDANENSSSCTATVTVVDDIAPEFDCPENISVSALWDNCFNIANWDEPEAWDNCGIESVISDPPSGTLFPVGETTVTVTATDVNGNETSCTFTVTITDDQDPQITGCPEGFEASNTTGQCGTTVTWVAPTASDNCPGVTLNSNYAPGSFFPVGTTTVTYTSYDASDNTVYCSFDVTVYDDENPVFTFCTDDITQTNDEESCGAYVSWNEPEADDNCGVDAVYSDYESGDYFPVGETTVTYWAYDDAENWSTCSFTVTVEDNEAPFAYCMSATVQLDWEGSASISASDVNDESWDNCGIDDMSVFPNQFTCENVGLNTVTLTVYDIHGNSSTCEATVTVEDNVAPYTYCESMTVQLDENGYASITGEDVDDGSWDACGIASYSVSPNEFNCENVGYNDVTLTVTDVNGNSSTCETYVFVEDNVAPQAYCQSAVVQLDENGNGYLSPESVDDGSWDACGIQYMEVFPNTFGCENVGENSVTLYVYDNNGNVSTCETTVMVEDNVAPEVVCHDLTVELDELGYVTIIAQDLHTSSYDACGIVAREITPNQFDCSNVGENSVTMTVVDANGNTSYCTSVVTVEDNTAPTAVCQSITVELDENGQVEITGADVDGGSWDVCGIELLSLSLSSFNCDNLGDNTVVLTVTDVNGNTSTCEATVTLEDNIAPALGYLVPVAPTVTISLVGYGDETSWSVTDALLNVIASAGPFGFGSTNS